MDNFFREGGLHTLRNCHFFHKKKFLKMRKTQKRRGMASALYLDIADETEIGN